MITGYDPDNIDRLDRQIRIALDSLRGINSDDPAASGAMVALATLRRVLDDDLLPAVASIAARDPLGRGIRWSGDILEGSLRLPRPRWENTDTMWSRLNNEDLMGAVRRMSPHERTPSEPYGGLSQSQFDMLVMEFTNRAAIDPEFAQMMIDELGTPLLGDIVLAGSFSNEVTLGVLAGLLTSAPSYGKEQVYRCEAIDQLLVEIINHPAIALDAIGDPELVELLLTFNSDTLFPIASPSLIADFLIVAMVTAPEMYPERRDEAGRALASLVDIGQDFAFDYGGPPLTSQALAVVFGLYLDEFAAAAHHACVIDMVGSVDSALGTREEVLGFLGGLIYDPTSRAVLAGFIADAATRAAGGLAPFTLNDVSALSVLINDAITSENVQLEDRARVQQAFFRFGFDFLNAGLRTAASITGVGALSNFLIMAGVTTIEDAAIDAIGASTTRAPDFALIGDLIIRMQIIKHAITDVAAQRPGTTATDVAVAQQMVDNAIEIFSDPDSTYADVERTVTRLEVDLAFILVSGVVTERVDDAIFVPRSTHDASDVCDNEFPTLISPGN
jgi:hypothetical protein